MSFQQQQRGVEELTDRLNQMQVHPDSQPNDSSSGRSYQQSVGSDLTNIHFSNNNVNNNNNSEQDDEAMDLTNASSQSDLYQQQDQQQQQPHATKSGNILIVTNVDQSVFSSFDTQSQFESLFLAHDNQVTFRYLRSFKRVRLDFTDSRRAESARQQLASFKIGDTICKCYIAQMIRPQSQLQQQQQENNTNYGNNLNECYLSSNHLNIPKLTKQFLISPPASPPVGWEPVHEGSPCIDVQLLSAVANLVPGKVHEIHQGNESQPGIYVEVCEEPQFASKQMRGAAKCHIPKTPLPLKPSAF